MSPQIVKKEPYNGFLNDNWALGVLIYRILCGNFPFKDCNVELLKKKIAEGQFIIPDFISSEAKRVINSLLTSVEHNRIELCEIRKFKFFSMY